MGDGQTGFFDAEVEEIAKQQNSEVTESSVRQADMAAISNTTPLPSETLELSFEHEAKNMSVKEKPNSLSDDLVGAATNYSKLDVTTTPPTHPHTDANVSGISTGSTSSDNLAINKDILDKATNFLTKINRIKDQSEQGSAGSSRADLAEAKAILASMNADFGDTSKARPPLNGHLNPPTPNALSFVSDMPSQAGKAVAANTTEEVIGQKIPATGLPTNGVMEPVSSTMTLPATAISVETPMPQIQASGLDKSMSVAPKPTLSAMASPDNIGDIIVRAVFNNKRAMIQIDPPEMGRVMMDFDFSEGFKTVVSLQADTEAGRRALQSRLGQIHALLTEQGFSEFEVKLEGPKSNLSGDSWSAEQRPDQDEQNSAEKSFGVNSALPDIEEVDAAADINQETVTDMIFNNRLNIRL